MQVLVDGDIVVFRAGFACEKTAYFIRFDGKPYRFQYKKELKEFIAEHSLEDIPYETDVELEPVANAIHTTGLMLNAFVEELNVNKSDVRVCLSGPNNFRYGVATVKPYKGNRDTSHRPTHEQALKDYLVSEWGATYSVDQEADDDLGIAQWNVYNWRKEETESIIVSLDKDLMMIPGLHYNFVKKESKYVPLTKANYNFFSQLLTGDTTDNIPGIPGCGPATAKKILARQNGFQDVADAYRKAYGNNWKTYLTEMGRLLWIRREPNEWWNIPENIL